tara:strand:+ start:2689 stop:3108 length:420 start_codon:yes stop_codon:yes gene_type:complete
MMFLIIVPLCLHIHNTPITHINYLKNNAEICKNTLLDKDISWEETYNCKNIIENYFHKMNINNYENNNENYYGYMFKIHGQPATLIIINKKYKYIEEFIINKNLILMFDASSLMRLSYYKKFKKINMENAINKDIFLLI